MASANGDIGRHGDGEKAAGDRRRLAARVQQQIERRLAQQQHGDRQRGRHDAGDRQTGSGEAARARPVAGAERARHRRRNGDGEADDDRQRDELQLAGVADRRLEACEPSRATQNSDRKSTANTATRPIDPVAVITATWRMVEPRVNTGASSRAVEAADMRRT